MERASTFFGIFGQIIQNSVRFIILVGRQYQILPAIYLVVFSVVFVSYANQPVTPPSPTPSPTDTPSAPNSTPPNSAPTFPPSAVEVAIAKAYKNGNSITVRFDKPVLGVRLLVDGDLATSKCEAQTCTATLSEQALQVQVSWHQGGDSFQTTFRL